MLSADKRGVSARRGMTVLGKIPAVPKPINLPSQRLENRGLDPNVEIVPRGSVSWGSAGRSPPTSGHVWGNSQQSSSPPVSSAPWGTSTKQTGESIGSASRPSSAGNGTRPSTADSSRQIQGQASGANAWNLSPSRPSSASGVLGHSHSQSSLNRPRSAETRPSNLQRSSAQFPEIYAGTASSQAWGSSGSKILADEIPQTTRFTLSHGDFPSLGSEKTQDLHPQQRMHAASTSEFESKEKTTVNNWKRDGVSADGLSLGPDGSWHGEGPFPSYPGHLPSTESWRKDGHGGVASGHGSSDYWHRSGPPTGPYGGGVGPIFPPGRFPYDSTGFMHHQQFGPGPLPPLRGGPVGYDRNGDGFRNVPFMRPPAMLSDRHGPPFGPVYAGPMPYEGFYPGPSAPGYGNMEDREMMVGMGNRPSFYGGFPHRPGPVEPFGPCRPGFAFGGNHPGVAREGMEMGYERESQQGGRTNAGTFLRENDDQNDIGNKVDRVHAGQSGKVEIEANSWKRDRSGAKDADCQVQRHSNRGFSEHPSHGHQDWGAASFVDEPMDFSRPVFEDDMASKFKKEASQLTVRSDLSSWEDNQKKERQVDDYLGETLMQSDAMGTDLKSEAAGESLSIETYALKKDVCPQNNQNLSPEHSRVDAKTIWLEDKPDASPALVAAHYSVCKPPTKEDNYNEVDATATTIGEIGNIQLNGSEGRAGLDSTGLRFGNVAAETSTSFLSSDSASYSGEISSLSEKNSGGFSSDLCAISTVDAISLPVEEISDFHTSGKHVPTIQESEKPDQGKINQHLSQLECGTDISDLGSDATFIGDKKGDTPASAGNKRVQQPKEEHRHKPKATSHDNDKEWRPKSVKVARDEKPKSSSNKTLVPKKPQTVSTSFQPVATVSEPAHATEKSLSSAENAESSLYDYDAQRAKMKEIAAQRAQQLQKEEEERTKEQKAKALAKLDELNRRTVAAVEKSSSLSNFDSSKEVSELGSDSMQLEKQATMSTQSESSDALSMSISSMQTVNEQANLFSLPGLEPNLMGTSHDASQPPNASAELSHANVTCSQPHDGHKPSGQQHVNFKAPHLHYRSKPFVPQLKDASQQPDLAIVAEVEKADFVTCASGQSIGEQPTGTMPFHDVNTPEISSKKVAAGQPRQHIPLRKKKNNRKENLMIYEAKTESSDLLNEVVKGSDYSSDVMKDNDDTSAAVKTIIISSASVSNTEVNESSTFSEEPSTFVWKDTLQGHGDVSKEIVMDEVVKVPQKHQQYKRPPRDRVSQDIRASDKQQIGEGMIWAPVRINSDDIGGSLKRDDIAVSDPITSVRDEKMDNQQFPEVKRAELERYTPKAIRRHAQNEHASEAVPSSGEINSFQYENQSSTFSSMARASAQHKSRQSLYTSNQQTNYRSGGRQHEFVGKSGRSQASWRQRGVISERVSDSVKEVLVHSMEDIHSPTTSERGTRGQDFGNRKQEHLSQIKQQQSRPAEGDWGSEQAFLGKKEKRPSSPRASHHNQSISIHENYEQKWAVKEDYAEVLDHSSVPASTSRHRGNLQKFEHVARNVGKHSGHIVSDTVDMIQGNLSNRKQVRDQQKPEKRADLTPRSYEPLINQDHEIEAAQGREHKKSHQTRSSHPPSKNPPPPTGKAWKSFSQGNEPEMPQSHFSSHTPDATVFSSNVQDGLPFLPKKASEKVSSDLQFGPSPAQHTKGGSSFDTHGREKDIHKTLQPPSKHAETNRQQGSYVTFDREQRDASNSYRRSSLGQLEHRKSVSQEKLQHTNEGYESYQRPRSFTSVSNQHDVALVDKDTELTTLRQSARSDNFREHRSSFEASNRQPSSSRFQNSSKSFQHVERLATSETRYDNDQKVYQSQWDGEGSDTSNVQGREHSHLRRGKFGGRVNSRSTDADSKKHSTKQELVIRAPTVAAPN